METEVLSRVCSRKLVDRLASLALVGGELRCLRMRFVRERLVSGQRSYVSHVVLAWEGTNGVRASARQCVCGQVASPYYDEW